MINSGHAFSELRNKVSEGRNGWMESKGLILLPLWRKDKGRWESQVWRLVARKWWVIWLRQYKSFIFKKTKRIHHILIDTENKLNSYQRGGGESGVWNEHVHTTVYKIDNQEGNYISCTYTTIELGTQYLVIVYNQKESKQGYILQLNHFAVHLK